MTALNTVSISHRIPAEHFRDIEQQRQASEFGMWLFLATEILFFGGLFVTYAVARTIHPAAFAVASHEQDISLGTLNTAILLISSLAMALAVHSAAAGNKRSLVVFLLLTIVLGCAFLGIKGTEYADKFHHHLVPGFDFYFPGPEARPAELYFSLYFTMTGMHALHMIIGILGAALLVFRAWRGVYLPEYHTAIENFGLYWHFVDIIWIFLYPLFYLIDMHR
jgi:cytochrome c oxidase subunit 3